MDENHVFIGNAKIDDIPWHRLATVYGRATNFPLYFHALQGSDPSKADKAGEQIALNSEHQSTLWPATPFSMIFLARIYGEAASTVRHGANRRVAVNLLDLFIEVAESYTLGNEMDHADPLPLFADMLKEEYLWSEEYDEEEDDARYEEDGGPFPDDLFYSFYYYSFMVLKSYVTIFQKYVDSDDGELSEKTSRLLSLMDRL